MNLAWVVMPVVCSLTWPADHGPPGTDAAAQSRLTLQLCVPGSCQCCACSSRCWQIQPCAGSLPLQRCCSWPLASRATSSPAWSQPQKPWERLLVPAQTMQVCLCSWLQLCLPPWDRTPVVHVIRGMAHPDLIRHMRMRLHERALRALLRVQLCNPCTSRLNGLAMVMCGRMQLYAHHATTHAAFLSHSEYGRMYATLMPSPQS